MPTAVLFRMSAVGLVAALSLTGCSGGSHDSLASGSGAASASPSAAPKPPVATWAQAKKIVHSYQVRNDRAVGKVRKAPHPFKPWRAVDAGVALANDRLFTAAEKHGYDEGGLISYDRVKRLYAPMIPAGAPQWFVAGMRETWRNGKKTTHNGVMTVFERAHAGAPWKQSLFAYVKKGDQPRPAPVGTATNADRSTTKRARKLAKQLAGFWNHGRKPAAFKASKKLANTLETASYQTLSIHASLLGGKTPMRVVRVAGGALVLAPYRAVETYRARRGTIHWIKSEAAVRGSSEHTELSRDASLVAAFLMPTKGKARVLGFSGDSVIW